jgi:hypothetical protein
MSLPRGQNWPFILPFDTPEWGNDTRISRKLQPHLPNASLSMTRLELTATHLADNIFHRYTIEERTIGYAKLSASNA